MRFEIRVEGFEYLLLNNVFPLFNYDFHALIMVFAHVGACEW